LLPGNAATPVAAFSRAPRAAAMMAAPLRAYCPSGRPARASPRTR